MTNLDSEEKEVWEVILSIRILVGKQIEFSKDSFIAYIDLENAFDKVPLQDLSYTVFDHFNTFFGVLLFEKK